MANTSINNNVPASNVTLSDGGNVDNAINTLNTDTSSLKSKDWILVDAKDITEFGGSTLFSMNIPTTAKEIYIEYGKKNNTQIYSGGTLYLIKNGLFTHPCFVPSFASTEIINKVYYFFYNTNILYYAIYYNADNTTGRIAVYYRE